MIQIGELSDYDEGLTFMLSIDGTHCPIEEPRPFSTENSSHKMGGAPAANYELGLLIHQPKLVWLHGPTRPGKHHDITVFRKKLKEEMEQQVPGRKAVGDRGYRGEPELISTRNEFDPEDLAEFKDRVLARHETFNAKVKVFKSMSTPWRHAGIPHRHGFRAVCLVVCVQLKTGGASLFDPYL